MNKHSEASFLKDSQWCTIDGELCRVIDFVPLGSIKDGKVLALKKWTPYASVTIECKKFPEKITGFVCHKMDFLHLWSAFKERGIKQNEEVLKEIASSDKLIHLAWSGLPNYKDLSHFEGNLMTQYFFLKDLIAPGVNC